MDSIQTVSALVKSGSGLHRAIGLPTATAIIGRPDGNLILKSLRDVSQLISQGYDDIPMPHRGPLDMLFESLGIERNEEVHSSAIATCFSSSNQAIGHSLLSGLLASVKIDFEIRPAKLAVHRERRLGSLPWTRNLPSEIQARRLDILIEHPDLVVAIENKVDSSESLNQTSDYYLALEKAYGGRKKVVCIFLTPDGAPPDSHHFLPLSYHELFLVFQAAVKNVDDSDGEFTQLYVRQIFDIFVEPRYRAQMKASNYWKGKEI